MSGRSGGVVAFDATALEVPHPAGVGRYTAQLLSGLLAHRACPPLALVAARPLPDSVTRGTLGQQGRRFPNRSIWMQGVLPNTLRRLRPRVCHFTNSVAPVLTSTPYIVTVHDMALFLFAHTQSTRQLLAARAIVPRVARRARAVVTVSESARRDILDVLKLPPEQVHVVYSAAGSEFRPLAERGELDRVKAKYRLAAPFVLHVGTIEPRKNLLRLLDAFVQLRASHPDLQLILAGQLGWKYRPVLDRIERRRLGSSIRRLDYVDAADLPALYNLALVVALPSLYEGFGLPILEGMASGTPVVTSNRSAMAEISGDAAILVDPERADDLADGLRRVIEDEEVRATLRAKGLHRAAEFSWHRTADQMIRLYDAVRG